MSLPMLLAMALQVASGWPWVGSNDPHGQHFRSDSQTVLTTRWRGRPVVMRLTPSVVPDCRAADWLHGAVADRQDRCVRIGSMEVTVAGAPMPISGDAYADLAGVNSLVLRSRAGEMVLYVLGPDGPDYYGATLTFGPSDVISRRLDLSDGGREVTTYTDAPSRNR